MLVHFWSIAASHLWYVADSRACSNCEYIPGERGSEEGEMMTMSIDATDSVRTSDGAGAISARFIVATTAALIVLGAVTGAIATSLILGIDALFDGMRNPTSVGFMQMIASIFRRIAYVLGVWLQAPLDGVKMGAVTGVAVSVAFVVSALIDRSWPLISQRRWLFAVAMAAAGAIGASAGSQGTLTDVRVWAAVAGALYGLVAAYTIANVRSEG